MCKYNLVLSAFKQSQVSHHFSISFTISPTPFCFHTVQLVTKFCLSSNFAMNISLSGDSLTENLHKEGTINHATYSSALIYYPNWSVLYHSFFSLQYITVQKVSFCKTPILMILTKVQQPIPIFQLTPQKISLLTETI